MTGIWGLCKDVDTVDAIAYFGEMNAGVTRPKKMLCSDGITRVVKFNYPSEWNRSLLHEYLGFKIAKLINIPVLDQSFVNVPPELAKVYSNIVGMSWGMKVGTPFYEIHKNINDNGLFREPLVHLYGSCVNKEDIPGILAFDIWLQNNDRGSNDGNLLILQDKSGRKKIYVHDHGFCFIKPTSDMERYKYLTEFRGAFLDWQKHLYPFGPVYEALKYHIDLTNSQNNPFIPIIDAIQSVTKESLEGVLKGVPEEWMIPEYEKNAIINFLYERRFTVRMVIDKLVEKFWFPTWNGGGLNWQELRASSE